jgi:hypothetical protein
MYPVQVKRRIRSYVADINRSVCRTVAYSVIRCIRDFLRPAYLAAHLVDRSFAASTIPRCVGGIKNLKLGAEQGRGLYNECRGQ